MAGLTPIKRSGVVSFGVGLPSDRSLFELHYTDPVVFLCSWYNHCALVCESGRVYTCGDNDFHAWMRPHGPPSLVPGLKGVRIVQAACGTGTTFLLAETGQLFASGWNHWDQAGVGGDTTSYPAPVPGIPPVRSVAAGWNHAVALDVHGDVWVCGLNTRGCIGLSDQMMVDSFTRLPALLRVKSIACGREHTALVTESGELLMAGSNEYLQLGLSGVSLCSVFQPIRLQIGGTVTMAACGSYHTVALMSDGTVWAWGRNDSGQLGMGTICKDSPPGKMLGLDGHTVCEVAATCYHTALMTSEGGVLVCGSGKSGEFGLGRENLPLPTLLPKRSELRVKQIVFGDKYSLLLVENKTNLALETSSKSVTRRADFFKDWGQSWPYVQVFGSGLPLEFSMTTFCSEKEVTSLSCRDSLAVIVCASGLAYTLGSNPWLGWMACGSFTGPTLVPLPTDVRVRRADCGVDSIFLMTDDGRLFTCGWNDFGQLGLGHTTPTPMPTLVLGMETISGISAGWFHAAARTEKGRVYLCGRNDHGQLGLGHRLHQNTFTQVCDLSEHIMDIACGGHHTALITASRTLVMSGWNKYHQLGLLELKDSCQFQPVSLLEAPVAAVALGYAHTMALGEDGAVWAWGWNDSGQLGLGSLGGGFLPTRLLGMDKHTVLAVYAGYDNTALVTRQGDALVCGHGRADELGLTRGDVARLTLMSTTPGLLVQRVAFGWKYSFVLGLPGPEPMTIKQNQSIMISPLLSPTDNHGVLSDSGLVVLGHIDYTPSSSSLTMFHSSESVTHLSCGERHSAVICSSGRAYTFGRMDYFGWMRPYTSNDLSRVPSLPHVRAAACGKDFSFFLSSQAGMVYSCGRNDCGQLGLGHNRLTPLPARVPDLPCVQKICAGWRHAVLLTDGGQVWVCGNNACGQLGLGDTNERVSFTHVTDLPGITDIDCGREHTAALTETRTLLVTGSNEYLQLGCSDLDLSWSFHVTPLPSSGVVTVVCGAQHTVTLMGDGVPWAWGRNVEGQLGAGAPCRASLPTRLVQLEDRAVSRVFAGGDHSAVLTAEGDLLVCGRGWSGELLVGYEDLPAPTLVDKTTELRILEVAFGERHSLLLLTLDQYIKDKTKRGRACNIA